MNVCIVENNIIVNVIVIPEGDDPAAYGGVVLPEGKWLGDTFDDSETEPTTEERLTALEDALAQTDETAIALYEAQAEQEAINAAQDEALIEIYEMMEG